MALTTNLPLDIIQSILQNLHVKSLLRFKAVCKSLNDIISDPRFIKIHRKTLENSSPHNLFLCKRELHNGELSLFKFVKGEPEFSELRQHPKGEVLCTGDGLVLLRNISTTCTAGDLYGLWNPASGKHAFFGCPYKWAHRGTKYGLCRDPNSDDFKVVIKHYANYAVFSCKDKTWTKKQKFQFNTTMIHSTGIYADGFSFWTSRDENHHTEDITYFDARDDMFKKIQKPELLENARTFFLTSVAGFLCVCDFKIRQSGTLIRMWIMKGHVDSYSWSELRVIETMWPSLFILGLRIPICFTEKNERVTSTDKFEHIMSSATIGTLAISKHRICPHFHVAPYVESLFFPIQDSTRTKRKRSSCVRLHVTDDDDDDDNK